ncbi:hypothetical protein M011DRAFT_472464 [Sporormia fimetaria CBS 119925]|uniref:Transcription factor SipA3 n=1 Tax=Sporormia fimetaria CBS 119925 TaxID=1340428 RepID=A0A6A6UYH6_9PLEO|nr:hypothetical protein M011DRAFT_472464 [Sporormia fimetaria CBS 119925]
MATEAPKPPMLEPVAKPLALIPVVVKEAALDSPTFRATAIHFSEQIDLIERWLDTYVKSVSKLASEMNALQTMVDSYINASTPPPQLSEAVLDHDYTVLALKRFGEGAREFWNSALKGMKRGETAICEPIRAFMQNDLRMLKDARKSLDSTQRIFDTAVARYAAQTKTKEPSSLREDAFQLHEARRAYLKASMDFCVMAPQVRGNLDKLLVKVITEQWRDIKSVREPSKSFSSWNNDIDRVRGWSKEMENGERVFKKELHLARQQVESRAETSTKPSRDLDDYAASTVPYLGRQAPSSANLPSPAKPDPANEKAEKQGWLFQRTITGKPARTYWVRRWFFVKNGIFGWLSQGARSGAVEESEKIGVLLCGIRPAFQEERRFCFEVKTKDTTVLLQAVTQNDLTEWISAFEVAKRKALEDPSKEGSVDAAFSISPPVAPEFAAKTSEGHAPQPSEDLSAERSESLPLPGPEGLVPRGSFDVSKRVGTEREVEGRRDHATRIMEKLDLARKSTLGPQLSTNNPSTAGGIASLISSSLASASHSIGHVGQIPASPGLPDPRLHALPPSTLAPPTLANPPAPTNLSKAAVAVSGDRGVGFGTYNMPGGLLANLWGSVNWGYINRLERGELETPSDDRDTDQSSSPAEPSSAPDHSDSAVEDAPVGGTAGSVPPQALSHKKSLSLGGPLPSPAQRPTVVTDDFPNYYPLALRVQDAQFRVLFPNVPRDEKLVMVIRAVWNPTEQQEFPGRVYVTAKDIYFYSNHLGLVLITGIKLASIEEVTAAPGKDCDFLFLHFKPSARKDGATRLTVKTFLEPLRLLQRRLNFLVHNADTNKRSLEEIIKQLIKYEAEDGDNSPSAESWEHVSDHGPMDPRYGGKDVKASLRIDGNLFAPERIPFNKHVTRFKLPSHPVAFAPQGMTTLAAQKEYDVSAKGLFHILFGDKSAVFQLIYRERCADRVVQGPWITTDHGVQRRDFEYEVAQSGKADAMVVNDYQTIEVLNDHLCYSVADRKLPWYLPYSDRFMLLSKIVITHVSKAKCKLAVYTKVDWSQRPQFAKNVIERQGLQDLSLEAQDLLDIVTDQVARLGQNKSTAKVISIFGQIGHQKTAAQFEVKDIPPPNRPRKFHLRQRTTCSVIAQLIGGMLMTAVAKVFAWLLTAGTQLGKTVDAHKLLIFVLLLSAGTNMFYANRDAWVWWQDRTSVRFMRQLGVGPSTSMSRAVYLRDLEESFLAPNGTLFAPDTGESNKCRETFASLLTDPHSPPQASLTRSTLTKRTQDHLQRTRHSLSTHRHDLLVALRVVNRIEQEVLTAEYGSWLRSEVGACHRLTQLLGESKSNKDQAGKEAEERIRRYCLECEDSLAGVKGLGSGLL